jgi:hypothetical protein
VWSPLGERIVHQTLTVTGSIPVSSTRGCSSVGQNMRTRLLTLCRKATLLGSEITQTRNSNIQRRRGAPTSHGEGSARLAPHSRRLLSRPRRTRLPSFLTDASLNEALSDQPGRRLPARPERQASEGLSGPESVESTRCGGAQRVRPCRSPRQMNEFHFYGATPCGGRRLGPRRRN